MTCSIIVKDSVLVIDCYDIKTNRLLHSVPIIKLYFHEVNLNNGRFILFNEEMPANKAFIRYDMKNDMPITEYVRRILNWINENNVKHVWSINGRVLDNNHCELIFGFEDRTIAFAFAMVWM